MSVKLPPTNDEVINVTNNQEVKRKNNPVSKEINLLLAVVIAEDLFPCTIKSQPIQTKSITAIGILRYMKKFMTLSISIIKSQKLQEKVPPQFGTSPAEKAWVGEKTLAKNNANLKIKFEEYLFIPITNVFQLPDFILILYPSY